MDLYLPIAEISINAMWLLALGVVVGFLSGLFGVGGGFLLTPLLTFMGVPPAIAVGTQANQLAGTSLSGALAYWRRRSIDFRMGLVLMAGSFGGAMAGVELFSWLRRIGQINLVINLGYVVLLSTVGSLMLIESAPRVFKKAARFRGAAKPSHEEKEGDGLRQGWGAAGRLGMSFARSGIRVNVLLPLGLGFVGGALVSLLGVGGGFIMVPAMIYILRMPPSLVSGTSLFQIFFTTAFASVMQAVSNKSVDIVLSVLLLIGGVIAVPMGARFASRLKPEIARFMMGAMVFAIALKMLFDLFVVPEHLFTVEMAVRA